MLMLIDSYTGIKHKHMFCKKLIIDFNTLDTLYVVPVATNQKWCFARMIFFHFSRECLFVWVFFPFL